MSQELFGEVSKHRNNELEEKRKSIRKRTTGTESLVSSCTMSYFPTANIDNIKEGKEMFTPPPLSKIILTYASICFSKKCELNGNYEEKMKILQKKKM